MFPPGRRRNWHLCAPVLLGCLILVRPAFGSDLLRARLAAVVQEAASARELPVDADHLWSTAPDLLDAIYERHGFEPLWTDRRAAALIALIRDAPSHGLLTRDYLLPALEQRAAPERLDPAARVDADLFFTEALLRYSDHLAIGKVHPEHLDPSWRHARVKASSERLRLLDALIDAHDLSMRAERELSHGFLYENLRGWLVRYDQIAEAGGWNTVSRGPTLHPGDTNPRVVEVRRRLEAEGFGTDDPRLEQYDEALEERVREFQRRYGLEVDGLVGRRTTAAMNVSAEGRVNQIRVNLERLRWVATDWEPRFVGVNIAGFRVYVIDGDEVRWSARAVVGRPYRRTPVFRANLTHLVLNPDWTVPPTILKNDTLPAIHADPSYLEANRMDVVDYAGRPVDPATIDWTRYPAEPFPYLIRQRPGPQNALGRIKFVFPNEHAVFLHDTPAKNLFERSERVFSSGCIRVERPLELAEILLHDDPRWSIDALERAIDTGATQTVALTAPVPILIVYFTAVAFEGELGFNFFNDIYYRDGPVLEALDAPLGYGSPSSEGVR